MASTTDSNDDVPQPGNELAPPQPPRGSVNHAPSLPLSTRGGVPLLTSRGEVITSQHTQNLMDTEGV